MCYVWKRVNNGILDWVGVLLKSKTVEEVESNSKAACAYLGGVFDGVIAINGVENEDSEIYTAFVRMIMDIAANHKYIIENSHEYGID